MWVQSLGQEDLLEKEMATHSNILAWKIPWMEEPGGLQSMGSQSQTQLSDFTFHFLCPNFSRPFQPLCYAYPLSQDVLSLLDPQALLTSPICLSKA